MSIQERNRGPEGTSTHLPRVSAIISTYCAGRFLAGCIDSLLAQTIVDQLEIIVVDSCSPENEGEIVAEYRKKHPGIVYLRTTERESLYKAWNRGIALARGTYVTNANTDDRLRPEALEILVGALEQKPDAALAYGDVIVSRIANRAFDWNLRDGWIVRPDFAPDIMLSGCHIGPQPLWRRSIHDEVGLFDGTLHSAADYDFWCRIALRHPFVHVPEFLGNYYDNPDGICNADSGLNARETRAVMARYHNAFPPARVAAASPPAYVNVAMITYNRLEFTRHAIAALVDSANYPYVLTVVDNGSTDGTKAYLEAMCRQGVIRNLTLLPENVGVAKAANLAWSLEADAAYYLKLDNDIVMTRRGWLREMVETIANDPELGAVAYNFEPRSYTLSRRHTRYLRIKDGNLGGACILIPRRTFDHLGYWCEDYGLYGEEDFDFGERLRLAGLLNAYLEDENAGLHLPAGKAAIIDAKANARDGAEESLHAAYRVEKDLARRRATRLFGQVGRNLADYASGRKPLRCNSAFVENYAHGTSMGSQPHRPAIGSMHLKLIWSALDRQRNRLAARLARLARSIPSLVAQAGPALNLLSRGRPGLERALNLARSNVEYRKWLAQDTITVADRYAMSQLLKSMVRRPLISILMPVCDPPEASLRLAIESVCRQAYPYWQLCVADDASTLPYVQQIVDEYAARDPRLHHVRRKTRGHIVETSNAALLLAHGEFIALLDHDDQLAEDALLLVAWQLDQTPDIDILFSDEDKIDATGRRFAPDFKPDWNPDLMMAQNACGHLSVLRTSLVKRAGGFRPGTDGCQDWDLVLRISEMSTPQRIVHLPFVLYHWRTSEKSTAGRPNAKNYVVAAAMRVVIDALGRKGVRAEVSPAPGNHIHVRYALPLLPQRVSILIPSSVNETSDVTRLVKEFFNKKPWPDLEILVAGKPPVGADTPAGLRYLPELTNVGRAAQGNSLAAAASGAILVFMRPALVALTPDTLRELVVQALRPEIGAVAPLLEAGGRVFETGLILGMNGPAGPAYRGAQVGDPGIAGRAGLARNCTIVSDTCMAVRREVFANCGGFAASDFPDLFHDIDFCLRLGECGLRVFWAPTAKGIVRNPDSLVSGTPSTYAAALLALRRRWGTKLLEDRYHNPNLALDRSWPTPAPIPRLTKPYRLV